MAYDLIDQPWIPVVTNEDVVFDVSLREALISAHSYAGLRDTIPTVEFGVYRVLVAVTHAATQIDGLQGLSRLLDAKRLPEDKINAYLDRWKDRFNLFDEEYPFLQSVMDGEQKPLAGLVPMVPSGTNANHFHRLTEQEFGVSPAAAARLLTAIAPFMNAGGAGFSPSINGIPPYYVLVLGSNLFETVALNLTSDPPIYAGMDNTPAWQANSSQAREEVSEAPGLLRAYTWQPRRIQLVPGKGGVCSITGGQCDTLVRRMRFEPGASTRFQWRDPNAAYKMTEKGESPLRPQEGREIWRQAGPLGLLTEKSYRGPDKEMKVHFERPQVVSQVARLKEQEYIDRPEVLLRVYGMRTDNAKVLEWQAETLALPSALVVDSNHHTMIQTEMDKAVEVANAMQHAIRAAYDRGGKGANDPFGALVAYTQRRFWQVLKPEFDRFLHDLSIAPAGQSHTLLATDAWRAGARRASMQIIREAVEPLDADGRAMGRSTIAIGAFSRKLWRIYPPTQQD